MITFACPQCDKTINSPESEIGKNLQCPHCKAAVVVPAGKSKTGLIVGLTALVVFVLGCPLFILIGLVAVSMLGTKASGTFTSVGQTIGGS
jgi:uncharacterized paraquat-inducible protein A